jgi:hypothetical protein
MAHSSLPIAAANSTPWPKYLLDMIPAAGRSIATAAHGLSRNKDNGDVKRGYGRACFLLMSREDYRGKLLSYHHSLRRVGHWQSKAKRRPLPQRAGDGDLAAVHLDE